MTEFIPPYPKRHEKWPDPLELIKYAREDLLSLWPIKAFQMQFNGMSIFNNGFFLANCPEVVQLVLVSHQTTYGKKNPLMRKTLASLLGNNFDSDEETWYKSEGEQANLFNLGLAKLHSETMTEAANQYTLSWRALNAADKVNIFSHMQHLTAEIICRMLFGKHLDTKQITQILSIFSQYQKAMENMDISLLLGLPSWFPKPGSGQIENTAKEVHKIIDSLIEQNSNNNQESILSYLLTLRDAKHAAGLTQTQLRNELILLFMAGHETMANTLTWAWYLISQSPEVEQKLHEELDSVLGSRSAGFEDLDKLSFTRAIIDETLRLYPPIPLLSREAKSNDIIRDRHIPAGSIMLVVPWLLHRHEVFWDKPNHFIPERFLADAEIEPSEFSYLPFSATPAEDCAKFFATIVATLSLATLAKNFRLSLSQDQEVTYECHLTLRPKNDLLMQISPR